MKKHHRGSREPQLLDQDFMEALDENDSSRASARRQEERKTQQFCRQVQRALNIALADRSSSDATTSLFVEEVCAAPDCGHLLVHVLIPEGLTVPGVMEMLRRESPRLRAEVAAAITRKRAPELLFAPSWTRGDGDE
ncbi:MAG: hypothetical protein QM757_17510 [Paludibaculum sp.]